MCCKSCQSHQVPPYLVLILRFPWAATDVSREALENRLLRPTSRKVKEFAACGSLLDHELIHRCLQASVLVAVSCSLERCTRFSALFSLLNRPGICRLRDCFLQQLSMSLGRPMATAGEPA